MNMILAGSPPIEIALRSGGRTRRLSLRVSQLDRRVTLNMPKGFPLARARAFAEGRENWIRRQLADAPEVIAVRLGGQILFEGREVNILPAGTSRFTINGADLFIPGDPATAARRLKVYLRQIAYERLRAASDHHARRIGRTYGKITLRDTRSRWGSCSYQGNLMYSWRLVMAPQPVLDYVAAHEVAHLAHLDHSQAFWRTVELLCPEYRNRRKWLRENGAMLHRYRFQDRPDEDRPTQE